MDWIETRKDGFEPEEAKEYFGEDSRSVQDEMTYAGASGILAILIVLMSIVGMILSWILYSRDRRLTFIYHAIALIIIMLFAIFVIFWSKKVTLQIRGGEQPNTMTLTIVFIGSIIFTLFLAGQALWFVFYKPSLFAYLVGLKTDERLWDDRMIDGSSFEDGWKSSRRMMWWTALFAFLSALCFAFIGGAANKVVWNRYGLARVGLYALLALMIYFAYRMLYAAYEVILYNKEFDMYGDSPYPKLIVYLSIFILVICVVNAFINFCRSRFGWLFMAFSWIIILFFTASASGLMWRLTRNVQHNNLGTNCQRGLAPFHENSLDDICINGGKYLPPGTSCQKQYLVNRWESDSGNELRFLNPACCELGKQYIAYPLLNLSYWTFMVFLTSFAIMALNFYLGDVTTHLAATKTKTPIADYIGLALVLLVLIIGGIWIGLKGGPELRSNPNSVVLSYTDPNDYPQDGWDIVPNKVLNSKKADVAQAGCLEMKDTEIYKTLKTSSQDCGADCIVRVAIYSENSEVKFDADSVSGSNDVKTVPSGTLDNIFSGCSTSKGSYKMLAGPASDVSKSLPHMKLCPKTVSKPPKFLFHYEEVKKSDLDSMYTKNGELNDEPTINPNCMSGYQVFTNSSTCEKNCSYESPQQAFYKLQPMKGKFYYIQNGQERDDIEADIQVTVSVQNEDNTYAGDVNLFEDGIFIIEDIPRYETMSYPMILSVRDPSGRFLPKTVEILVPSLDRSQNELSAGFVRLLTPTGTPCNVGDSQCMDNQTTSQGTLVVSAMNNVKGKDTLFEKAKVEVFKKLIIPTQDDTPVATSYTDKYGKAVIKDIPYGSYTIKVSADGFDPIYNRVYVDSPTVTFQPNQLVSSDADEALRVTSQMLEPAVDFSLYVKMENEKGNKCTISPENKYCPYSAHLSDVAFGTGEEVVTFKKLAVANYMSYLAPSSSYDGSCKEAKIIQDTYKHFEEKEASWDWNNFKKTQPIEKYLMTVKVSAPHSTSNIDSFKLGELKTETTTQTKAESQKYWTLLGRNGFALSNDKKFKAKTDITTRSNWDTKTADDLNTNQTTPASSSSSGSTPAPQQTSSNSHLLANCFTGFGKPSVLILNKYQSSEPSMQDCIPQLEKNYPSLSIKALRQAVDEAK